MILVKATRDYEFEDFEPNEQIKRFEAIKEISQ
jgi:hypothetical protein